MDYPKQIRKLDGHHVIKIACGGYHTLVLTADNQLFAFGSAQYGECGSGDSQNCMNPTKVILPLPEEETSINAEEGVDLMMEKFRE